MMSVTMDESPHFALRTLNTVETGECLRRLL
jgi:hypothetical protein